MLSSATGVLRQYTVTEKVGGNRRKSRSTRPTPVQSCLPVDLNSEGSPEIAVVGPSAASAQELVFYVLGEPPTKYPLSFTPFNATFADVDSNGTQDLIALEDNVLVFVADEDRFISQGTVGIGESGRRRPRLHRRRTR